MNDVFDFATWAIQQHDKTNQRYGEGSLIRALPYSFHLECVVAQLKQIYPKCTPVQECIAWGHDLIEDARVSYNDIKLRAGKEVAEGIYACTELRGRNRAERHGAEYLSGLAANKDGLIVKLADIAANALFSKLTGSGMYKKYQQEWVAFCTALNGAFTGYGYPPAVAKVEAILYA